MKRPNLLTALNILFIAISLLTPAPSFAQAYQSQLHFLEQFAIKQYDHGNLADAAKEFQRILRIQPDNATAREYLKKIADKPATSAKAKADIEEVISDIDGIKTQLKNYEKDAQSLEYMIRNLISENDALYQSLYKRSREVVELREKFYGTPYGDAYAEVMKDIPIDRIPQRLHPSNEILPETSDEKPTHAKGSFTTTVDTQEVNALIADISALAKQRKAAEKPTIEVPQLTEALQANRETLLETTAATAEKQKNLEKIKDELTTINTRLKSGVDRYMEAIHKIDRYYSSIKDDVAKKNFTEQKLFSKLVADYADRIKEIEELKRSTPSRSKELAALKPTLASEDAKIEDLKKTMAARDAELASLKSILIQYKKDLSERDTLIRLQKDDLALTEKGLSNIDLSVKDIEKSLGESSKVIAELNKAAPSPKPKAPEPSLSPAGVKQTAVSNDIHIKETELQNAELLARIDLHERALGKSGMRIRHLERQLATVTTDLNRELAVKRTMIKQPLLDKINDLESTIKVKDAVIANLKQSNAPSLQDEINALKQSLTETIAQKDDAFQKLDAAGQKIETLERSARAKDQRLAELSEAVVQLQQDTRTLHPVSGKRASDDDALHTLETRLRRSQDLLSDAEATATRATTTIAELNDQLAARDLQIKQLQLLTQVNQGEELKALKRQLNDQDATIMELTHENRTLKQTLENNLTGSPDTSTMPLVKTSARALTNSLMLKLKNKKKRIIELEKNQRTLEKNLKAQEEQLASQENALRAAQEKIDSKDQAVSTAQREKEMTTQDIKTRDDQIATLSAQVNAMQEETNTLQEKIATTELEISRLRSTVKDLQAKRDEAVTAQLLAEGNLQARATEIATLEVKIKDLRNDIRSASELMDNKTRDNAAAMAEIKRLNDIIEKKNADIANMQLRLNK